MDKRKNVELECGGKRALTICIIQLILSLVFLFALIEINLLPETYVIVIAGLIIALEVIVILWQVKFSKAKWIGQMVSVVISLILIFSSVYTVKANNTLDEINNTEIKLENMVVAVLASDYAENITEAMEYTFAIQELGDVESDEDYYSIIVTDMEEQMECCLETIVYASLTEEIIALENNEVDAIIYNEAYMVIVEDQNPEIIDTLKVIYEYGVEIQLEAEVVEEVETGESNVFSVYFTGIDTYGSIIKTSRSDVNVIAVVNMDTEQILLVTTPRDYYVTFPEVTGDSEDKLTHAGIYGVDVSVDTLEALYDTSIDYYIRVNFSSFTTIVDALGGIEVYSSQSFYTTEHSGVSIYVQEGYNDFTGSEALLFARERYNLADGDFQRGENHEEIIKAIIEKVSSSAILTGAYEILDSISDSIDTDMPTEVIQELIKTQIDEGTEWEIIMVSAKGTTGSAMCYSYAGGELSVVYPDEDSVLEISEMIDAIYNGEILE